MKPERKTHEIKLSREEYTSVTDEISKYFLEDSFYLLDYGPQGTTYYSKENLALKYQKVNLPGDKLIKLKFIDFSGEKMAEKHIKNIESIVSKVKENQGVAA